VVELWERQSAALESLIGLAENAPRDVSGTLSELVQRVTAIVPSDIGIVETIDFDGSMADSAALVARRPQGGRSMEDGRSQVVMTASAARQVAKTATPGLQSASIPMRLADRTVGVVTVYRTAPYSDADRALLEAIAGYGALAIQGSAGRLHGESALSQLMTASTDAAATAVLERFGWTPGVWAAPVVVRCDPEFMLASGRSLDSVVHTVEGVLSGKWRRVLASPFGVVAAIVITPQEPGPDEAAMSWAAQEVAVALEDKGQSAGVAIGAGAPAAGALEIAQQFREAASAANWAAASGNGVRMEVASRSSLARQIINVGRALAPDVERQLALASRVHDYDSSHGTDLLSTLEVFVREQGSVQRTSERLFIHRNTLRQRLNKISSLLGESVEDVRDWLPVLLAILVIREP